MPEKHCFVVMGFGEKTDYITGRKLDLNQSYRLLIKPVVEKKGYVCLRADEIKHSGVIDEVMYRELFQADLVIADLSAANLNAFYELGVRHALRPFTTIVISEDKLPYPFNLTHISIEPYQHLGADIGYSEVKRFRKVLGDKIDAVKARHERDSPIYTFLTDLVPPSLKEKTEKAIKAISDAVEKGKAQRMDRENLLGVTEGFEAPGEQNSSLSKLTQHGEQALKNLEFEKAKKCFEEAFKMSVSDSRNKNTIDPTKVSLDPYLVHRIALTTYKAAKPTAVAALKSALDWLEKLDLYHTNDPETVALAGAIEKKLYEKKQGVDHLSRGILYLERGYFLLNNLYNAVNLAYMLNCRADSALDATEEEKIADLVNAKRVRQRILVISEHDYAEILERETKLATTKNKRDKELIDKFQEYSNTQKFWIWSIRQMLILVWVNLKNIISRETKQNAWRINPG